MKTALDVVLKYYEEITKMRGIPPTERELLLFVKKHRLTISRKALRKLRWYFEATALFGRSLNRTRHYASSSIKRYGTCFLDLAYFETKYFRWNKGMRGFLCIIESLTGKMGLVGVPNFTRKSWERGIHQLLSRHFSDISYITTDADVAVSSKTFINKLYETYGVKLVILGGHRKAYKAERGIRIAKSWLSMAMKADNTKNWIDFLPKIEEFYNDQLIPGSKKFKRKDVNINNYMKLLAEISPLGNGVDVENNLGNAENFSQEMQSKIFKYKLGDKVLVGNARAPDFYDNGGATFKKKSVLGGYSKKIRTIVGLVLKKTSRNYLTVCYRLKGETGIFYKWQLRLALYRDQPEPPAPPSQFEEESKTIERPNTRAFLKSLKKKNDS